MSEEVIETQNKAKGILLVLLSSLMFGSYGIWSRLMGGSFAVFYQGWTRGLIIAFLLLPILLLRKEFIKIKRKDWGWLTVFLIFTSATQAPIYYAFNHMDIGTATLLFFVSMLLTMYVVGFSFLGERISWVKVTSFVIAIVGLIITFSFSIELFSVLALSAAIASGVASGGEVSFSKKLTGNYSALYVVWLSWVIIFISNGIISLMLGEPQLVPTFNIGWFYQLCYIIASLLGFWAVIAGLKYIESSIGGLIGLLEVIFSIGLGIAIFSEGLTTRVILGGILIIIASALPHFIALVRKRFSISNKFQHH